MVDRCFTRLKQFRDLAARYAKRAAYYAAELTIAAIILWLRWTLRACFVAGAVGPTARRLNGKLPMAQAS